MPAPKEYNGHRSWNAWNVSLWIANDEPLYRMATNQITNATLDAIRLNGISQDRNSRTRRGRPWIADAAAHRLRKQLPARTPDGAKYTQLAVKLAMLGLMEE